MKFFISFIIGYISGIIYFYHLYKSVENAILNKKKNLKFFYRFLFLSVIAILVAYYFKAGIIFFLIGFYLSRLTFSKYYLKLKSI